MTPELTVLIACRGQGLPLSRCLVALERQTLDPSRFEVLLIDDGSMPPLTVAPTTLPLRVLTQAAAGPAAARNHGLRHARGTLVLFLNADAVPHPELLERHLAHHETNPAPHALLGRFDYLPGLVTPFLAIADACGTLFPYHLVAHDTPLHFTFFWTGNLSVPRSALDAVGGFYERFRRPLFEDTELGYRLFRAGLPLLFGPDLECGHDHPVEFFNWLARAEAFGHEWTLFAAHHGDMAMPILVSDGVASGCPEDDELWAICLHEHDAHTRRIARLSKLLASSSQEDVLTEGLALLEPINLIARMRGVLAGRLGFSPDDLARHRRHRHPLALVHTVLDEGDLTPLAALLGALPDGAQLLLSYDPELTDTLAAHPLVTDSRLSAVPFGDSPWLPLLKAYAAETFILLSGDLIPSAAELLTLASYLDLNPGLGVVTLGPPGGSGPRQADEKDSSSWTAELVTPRQSRAEVVATTRSTLACDTLRPEGLTFFERVERRGLKLALATPPAP